MSPGVRLESIQTSAQRSCTPADNTGIHEFPDHAQMVPLESERRFPREAEGATSHSNCTRTWAWNWVWNWTPCQTQPCNLFPDMHCAS